MADVTPTNIDLCGAVIPWPFSATLAADHAHGTDYTEASRQLGVTTHDASTTPRGTFVADASGTPDASTTQRQVRVVRGGQPGPGRATVVTRADSSDTWHGADQMGCPVYAQQIVDASQSHENDLPGQIDPGTPAEMRRIAQERQQARSCPARRARPA